MKTVGAFKIAIKNGNWKNAYRLWYLTEVDQLSLEGRHFKVFFLKRKYGLFTYSSNDSLGNSRI